MKEKILLIQTAFIGDAVLATSVLEKLHQYFPEAQLDFLIRKGHEGLFDGHPFIHELLVWEKKKNKNRNLMKMLFRIRKNRYHTVINLQRYASTGLLTGLSGAKERIGFDKNPFSFLFSRKIKHEFSKKNEAAIHEVERNNRLIEHLTGKEILKPKLYPRTEDEKKVYRFTRLPYIVVAPGSVWYTKRFPADKWLPFLNMVPYDYSIYLIGGKEDYAIADEIKLRTANPYVMNLCGELSFLESVEMVKKAAMNYVNDSAPMHFASATNAPVTAIYCSTVPAFGYGPLSDINHIIQYPGQLYCRPCGLHGHNACPEGHFRCALDIDIMELMQVLPPAPKLIPLNESSE